MKFRPCIDLHAGQVKQIVGSTLTDDEQNAMTSTSSNVSHENFSTDKPASEYAIMYQKDKLQGGHVIMLGSGNVDAAKRVGEAVAKLAKEKNVTQVVFDRNGFLYHGRVKALAEAIRETGLLK